MLYIDTPRALKDCIAQASSCDILAIDTEFLREKTYFAKLCLVQMGFGDEVALIDPLALDDLTALAALFEQENIVKVFHAGSQDIEILYRRVGVMPRPVFDTQIAAAILGYSHQTGLGALVGSLCGTSIKKSDSFTDWSVRPLAASQLEYAAEDVIYLPALYQIMTKRLREAGRLAWLDSDFADLIDPARFEIDPRLRYQRLKRANQLSRKQLAAAREMAAWREEQAQVRDIPRKWVLSDEQIVEACKREAKTIDDLYMVRGLREKLPVQDARFLVRAMKEAYQLPVEELPQLPHTNSNEPNVDNAVDLMLALVRLRSKESGIAMQTLASHAALSELARGHRETSELLRGWRKHIIGDELVRLLDGDISLALEDNELVVCEYGHTSE